MKHVLSIALVVFAASPGHAEISVLAYVCTFDKQAFTTFNSVTGDEPYTIETTNFEMTFAAIDFDAHRAQLIGNQGAAAIYATKSPGSAVFIEQTPSGNVNLTNVLDADANGRIRAVTSRHIISPGGIAMMSQLTGTCIAKN